MRDNIEDYEMLASAHLGNPKLVEWFKRRLASATQDAIKAKGEVEVRWAQGRAQELDEIVTALEGAVEILRKADDRASQ